MSQAAREPDFAPSAEPIQQRWPGADKWWAPVAPLDWEGHSAHNIALTACALGVAIGSGACVAVGLGWTSAGILGIYVAIVALYHMLEYLSVALYNPERVEIGSFMFNPDVGNGYIIAMAVSVAEYIAECMFFGRAKSPGVLTVAGLVVASAGQAMRTLAMVTAGTSFNHYVATRRHADHQLVAHGIYRYERHPSYVGFFLWAVGLQMMLKNPVSLALFAAVLGTFFTRRTRREEIFLLHFFGDKYRTYKRDTPSLIPVANIEVHRTAAAECAAPHAK